ncbi:hypothetical protein D3C76_1485310 [compost metagenome]
MDVLPVGRVRHLGVVADTEGALRAAFGEVHLDFLALQLRLAETFAEQLGRNAAVLLADLHVDVLALAVHYADFAVGEQRQGGKQEKGRKAHGQWVRVEKRRL